MLQTDLLARALAPRFLKDRMAFIAGPRQIGKTTLLQDYLGRLGHPEFYYNWDTATVRRDFQQDPDFFSKNVGWDKVDKPVPVVFDEIHKYPEWKNHLKGLYDSWKGRVRFIVTGSARLDFMRKSGDSLVGRYFLFRKLPLHPRDVVKKPPDLSWIAGRAWEPSAEPDGAWKDASRQLMDLNGFPEPFYSGSTEFLTRWQTEHLTLLVTEDLADLSRIEKILKVEELAVRLRNRIGAPLSTNALSEDLQTGFPTIKRWLEGLELVYLTFRIPPYTRNLERAIRKEPKLYFWDWSLPLEAPARFENRIAAALMRAVHVWNEEGLGQFELHYVRTRDGVEVDFLVTDKKKPVWLVEAKSSDETVAPNLLKVKSWLKIGHATLVVQTPGLLRAHRDEGVWVMGLDRFLQMTP